MIYKLKEKSITFLWEILGIAGIFSRKDLAVNKND